MTGEGCPRSPAPGGGVCSFLPLALWGKLICIGLSARSLNSSSLSLAVSGEILGETPEKEARSEGCTKMDGHAQNDAFSLSSG